LIVAEVEVIRQYMFPARIYDFPVESDKPKEKPRPNFNVSRLVDEAVEDGRIAAEERASWGRRFEEEPHLTRRMLLDRAPDQLRASRNYFAAPNAERAYVEHFRANHGEDPIF
jgi:hypothetical protein